MTLPTIIPFTKRTAFDLILDQVISYWDDLGEMPMRLMSDVVVEWLLGNQLDCLRKQSLFYEPETWHVLADDFWRNALPHGVRAEEFRTVEDIPRDVREDIMLGTLHQKLTWHLDARRGPNSRQVIDFIFEVTPTSLQVVEMDAS